MEDAQIKEVYEFGAFQMDMQNRLLCCKGKTVALTIKEFEVLLFFVANAGRVLEKEELLEALWKDTFIEEGTLTQHISRLRKKLEAADGSDEKIIETLPRRGYRFLPAVTAIKIAPASLAVEEQTFQHLIVEETVTIDNIGREEREELYSEKQIGGLATSGAIRRFRSFALLWICLGLAATTVIAFALFQFSAGKAETKTVTVAKIKPFSGFTGRETMPAFSPDSKQMAFAWDGGDGEKDFDIYVKLIDAGEPVRLTTSATNEIHPTFSPDGSHIAFVRVYPEHNDIVLIPALGGAERLILSVKDERASVSFSPDGLSLAVIDAANGDKSRAVFLVNLQTGERRQLTAPREAVKDTTPRFSPDCTQVAFLRSSNSLSQEVWIAAVKDGAERQLTFDKAGIRNLAWSADGKHIVFASFRASNHTNLWQIAATGGEPRMIATSGKNIANIAVSPDNRMIAFTEVANDENIWRIGGNGEQRKIIASSRDEHSQQISPDGTQVAFVSDRTGNNEIWRADTNGKNQRKLTDSNGNAGSPRFSPDGKFIAYDAQSGKNFDVFIVSAEGGAPRRLTDSQSRSHLPAWSADGKSIFFRSNRTGSDQLWKIPADGSAEAVQITRQGAFEGYATPDGKTVFYSKERGVAGLWRVSVDGGDEQPAPEGLANAGYYRSWTMTNAGIYFIAHAEQPPHQIFFYDFATGEKKEFATVQKPPLWVYSGLSASADGKTILYAQRDQNASSIMLAELPD